jgi:serine/threonine protein kinase
VRDEPRSERSALSPELARALEQVCDRFEGAWQSGVEPRLEDYLASGTPQALRPELLRELILLDIDYRQARGQSCSAATYRQRFPELSEEWLASALKTPLATAANQASISGEQLPEAGPGQEPGTLSMTAPASESSDRWIGPYKLLQKLGEGGMGAVFVAEQEHPVKRRVALKIIKAGMDSAQVIARFEQERQALALMDHPNIAKVLDAGTTANGRPYFVMELVKGIPITKFCDHEHLTPKERLELFIPVCHAIQHAHQKGIIHRDLKPSNVIIALYDGKPVPKVIDFGVAKATSQKLTERTVFTEVGQMIGTLEYMAPEQAELNNLDIDTRADIFALGVLLYELLTGSPPFTGRQLRSVAFTEMLRMIRELEPPKPSTKLSSSEKLPSIAANRRLEPAKLTRLVSGDLDWIVMKALTKERDRRYETASGFAKDIERFLNHEPVLAGPPSSSYRLRKFVRRNRGQVIAASLVLFALLAGIAGTTFGLIRAVAAQEAESRRAEGEQQAKQEALEREAETKAALEFVENRVFAAARPKDQAGGLGYDVKLADAIKAALPFVDTSFTSKPLIEARLRKTMATSFRYLGHPEIAIDQDEKARALYSKHLGPEHRNTLASMNNLALSYDRAGRTQEALKLREETLELQKTNLGLDAHETLMSMNNLAVSYMNIGRTQEALKLHEETLKLMKAKLGPDHPDTLKSMINLTTSYANSGRVQEAIKLSEETLTLAKAKLGPDHPDTLISMGNLAFCYGQAGRTQEALKLNEETLPLMRAKLGPDHPDTLHCMTLLAWYYAKAGRTKEALRLREETLELKKTKLGPDHPDTLKSMAMLANSYEEAGRTKEALKLREETLELQKAKLGPDHPDTLTDVNNLAKSYNEAGRVQEALKLHEQTLQLRKARLGPDHPDTFQSMENLASSYIRAGRTQEALKLREETLQRLKARLGIDHPDTLRCMNNLAADYIVVGKAAEAEAILQETFAARALRVKGDPSNTLEQSYLAWTQGQLGEAAQAQDDYPAAVQAYARSVEMFQKLYDAGAKDSFFRGRASEYRQRLAFCRKAEHAAKDLDFALKQPKEEVLELLDIRVRVLLKERKLPAAVESAAKLKERVDSTANQLYDAACAYALYANEASAGSKLQVADATALAKKWADEAMAILKQAVAKGYKDAEHMKTHDDLKALRPRDDFKKLLAELEAGKHLKK